MFDPKPHLIQLPRRVNGPDGRSTTVYDAYLEVKWRLVWFREKYPRGAISTQEICVDLERGYARFRALVSDGAGGRATGYGTETAAGFADYVERAETRALGRALAALGVGTQFVGRDLTEGDHVAEAPVATAGAPSGHSAAAPEGSTVVDLPPEGRISRDQARELKKAAQAAFGFAAGERRLRQDLGLAADTPLTLMRLCARVPPARYQALMEGYDAHRQVAVEADVPAATPPASTGQPPDAPTPERPPDTRGRWGVLSRRALAAGLPPATWDALRQGDLAIAERVLGALESAPAHGPPG